MVVPVAPAPSRNPLLLFAFVALAVIATRIYLHGAALWPSVGMGVAARRGGNRNDLGTGSASGVSG